MINIVIDNKNYSVDENSTILEVCKKNNIFVPSLCYYKRFTPLASCRVCLVMCDGKMVTACTQKVNEGAKIDTKSDEIIKARKTNLELLLSNHNYDCDNCVRNGECELQNLTKLYNADPNKFSGEKSLAGLDLSSSSIVRDNSKCILCNKCVNVCSRVQSVNALSKGARGFNTQIVAGFNGGVASSNCVGCGQCVMVCPTGALSEKNDIQEVLNAISDKSKIVVAGVAPSVRVALGEEFGGSSGVNREGIIVNALKQIGFKYVFDVNFAADITAVEEAKELLERLEKKKNLPLFTSCCPSWVDYVLKFFPEFKNNLSTTKSPQQILGAVCKNYFAKKMGINPLDIVVVTIMPCTAKKSELTKEDNDKKDVDYSLTVRELVKIIKDKNIQFNDLRPVPFDDLLGQSSGSGVIFGTSGGVMEAAIRTAASLSGIEGGLEFNINNLRCGNGLKTGTVRLGKKELKYAVVSGLSNTKNLLEKLNSKELNLDFVEVMGCEGGCVNGGGMPRRKDKNKQSIQERSQGLYSIDKTKKANNPLQNQEVIKFYDYIKNKSNKPKLHTK